MEHTEKTGQPFSAEDRMYMGMALEEAGRAAAAGDVPVGAVVVHVPSGKVIARASNTREQKKTAIGHAEIQAIGAACEAMGDWRLGDCVLYVTLEPCPMCAGAILHARIPRVVCGTKDPVAGAMGSIWSLQEHPFERSRVSVVYGCREDECRDLLQTFFRERRGGVRFPVGGNDSLNEEMEGRSDGL